MERNRRVAKAYARSPVITIDNGTIGFDGDCIGLRGFDSPYRDSEILITHKSIGSGVAIGADEAGNILVQLIQQRTLYLRQLSSTCADDILIKANGKLKPGTVYKIFCMKKFLNKLNSLQSAHDNKVVKSNLSNIKSRNRKSNNNATVKKQSHNTRNSSGSMQSATCLVNKSGASKSNTLRGMASTNGVNSYRRHSADDDDDDDDEEDEDADCSDENITRVNLENQCFTVISLSSHAEGEVTPLLDTPVWIIVINIIALEMLHRNLNLSKLLLSLFLSSLVCLVYALC